MDHYHVIDLIGEGSFGKVRHLPRQAGSEARGTKETPQLASPGLPHLHPATRCTRAGENVLVKLLP